MSGGKSGPPPPHPSQVALWNEQRKASQLMRKIGKEQWALWKEHYNTIGRPRNLKTWKTLQDLGERVDDWASPGRIAMQSSMATRDVGQAFDRERKTLVNTMNRYNMAPGDGRFAGSLRTLAMGKAAEQARASTGVRAHILDQDMDNRMKYTSLLDNRILTPSTGHQERSTSLRGLSDVSRQMTRYQQEAERIAAEKNAAKWGAMGQVVGMAGGAWMLSDRRLKQNIKHIDDLPFNLKLYEFEFKQVPGRKHVGVMAQEVQKVKPHLVRYDRQGYMCVDYGNLFNELMEV